MSKKSIPTCALWRVTYRRQTGGDNLYTTVAVANVYAVNRRFALWNAQAEIGHALPGDIIVAIVVKAYDLIETTTGKVGG
jgi:hypothetical protein